MSYKPKHAMTTSRRIIDLMADGKPRAATQVAKALGIDSKKVGEHLRRGAVKGPSQKYRSVDRAGPRRAIRYVAGSGENVDVRPYGTDRDSLDDAEVDQFFRSDAKWWPVADVVVLSAIDAMVRQGVTP